jgi:uncharacterized protein (TIGR03437 family)
MRLTAIPVIAALAGSSLGQAPPCTIRTIAGPPTFFSGDGGPARAANFLNIGGFRFDAAGNLYIADSGNQRVREVTPNGIVNTIAGNGVAGFSGDGGPATNAELNNPVEVFPDNQGNLYIVDQGNNRIRKVDASGNISTVAGNGVPNFGGDGGLATAAEIQKPTDVIADSAGNLYIADSDNQRVREVTSDGIISSIAGTALNPFPLPQQFGGPATDFYLLMPVSLAMDSTGDLYVADNELDEVVKIAPTGLISNFTPIAPQGQSYYPEAIAFDASGNLTITTGYQSIEVSPNGAVLQTNDNWGFPMAFNQNTQYSLYSGGIYAAGSNVAFAGGNEAGNTGDGGSSANARFTQPGPTAVDTPGNVYVSDMGAQEIRKVSPAGIITSFAAGVIATALTTDNSGNLYFTDYDNGTVRKIDTQGSISTVVTPNPALTEPNALGVDPVGNLYVSYSYNEGPNFSGSGVYEFAPDGIQVNSLYDPLFPNALAWTIDRFGNMYALFSGSLPQEYGNPYSIDHYPYYSVAADASGNLFIGTSWPDFGSIQEETADGRLFTLARQNESLPYISGTAAQVDLGSASYVSSDAAGNVYFSDPNEWTVRSLTAGCPVVSQPLIAAQGIVNAGSYSSTLAGGELAALFGANLGPATGAVVPVTSGAFPTTYNGVEITVGGIPAPLLYVSQSQINFVVPSATAGQRELPIQVSYNSVASDPYIDTASAYAPGVLAVANDDGSVNTSANAAGAGSYVVIYATGSGAFAPQETDGEIIGDILSYPVFPVTVTIDNQPATVLYAGSAPDLVAGVLQINLQIPAQISTGQHTLIVLVSSDGSPPTNLYTQ